MLAMNPTPQESFSRLGSYSPKASGRQVCSSRACSSRAGSSEEDSDGLAFVAAVSAWPRICSRSNSDPLIVHPLKDSRALEPDDFLFEWSSRFLVLLEHDLRANALAFVAWENRSPPFRIMLSLPPFGALLAFRGTHRATARPLRAAFSQFKG